MEIDTEGGPRFWRWVQDRSLPQGEGKNIYIFESQVEMRTPMLSLKLLRCVQNPEAHWCFVAQANCHRRIFWEADSGKEINMQEVYQGVLWDQQLGKEKEGKGRGGNRRGQDWAEGEGALWCSLTGGPQPTPWGLLQLGQPFEFPELQARLVGCSVAPCRSGLDAGCARMGTWPWERQLSLTVAVPREV